jgi:hypothetical protein
VAGGVGLVGAAVGSVFGIITFSKAGVTQDGCPPNDAACLERWRAAYDEGQTTGMVSTLAFGVGLAGLGAGAALLLLSRSSGSPERKGEVWLSPRIGAAGAEMALGGRW